MRCLDGILTALKLLIAGGDPSQWTFYYACLIRVMPVFGDCTTTKIMSTFNQNFIDLEQKVLSQTVTELLQGCSLPAKWHRHSATPLLYRNMTIMHPIESRPLYQRDALQIIAFIGADSLRSVVTFVVSGQQWFRCCAQHQASCATGLWFKVFSAGTCNCLPNTNNLYFSACHKDIAVLLLL